MTLEKDLKAVGESLRSRRKERHVSRTDLARKVGVSPTYLWMIEEAKERANGEASQPSQFLLSQLAAELAMSHEETYELLELAGYQPVDDAPTNGDNIPSSSLGNLGGTARQSGHAPSHPTALKRLQLAAMLEEVRRGILSIDEGTELVIPQFAAQIKPFPPEGLLSEALKLMDEQRYSQVVAQDGPSLRLVSAEGITRWLLEHGESGAVSLENTRIRDVLEMEPQDTLVVLSENSTVSEAMSAFVQQPSLIAIVVTASGSDTEPPIGIVTPWDLLDYVQEQV